MATAEAAAAVVNELSAEAPGEPLVSGAGVRGEVEAYARGSVGQAWPGQGRSTAPAVPVDEPRNPSSAHAVQAGEQVAITVRYAPVGSWVQRTLYFPKDASSDDIKWRLRDQLGAGPSVWRVHEGYRGMPYDRFTPVVDGPPGSAENEMMRAPLVIAPSFGP